MKVYGGVMAATPLPPIPASPGDAGVIGQIAASLAVETHSHRQAGGND